MNRRIALVLVLLAVHSVVSVLAIAEVGYVQLFRDAFTQWSTGQIFSDLSCSLLLISAWMLKDGRDRGLAAWPFVLAMLPLGSFAWMGYLLVRELVPASQPRLVVD
jgi:hypothetical protein